MWKLKQLMPKEQTGLEGRSIDIGNLKVQIRNAIAEGGFSSVYLARDAINGSKLYALKHLICNDEESLELVKKEISVMKSLRGHPNVVMLYAHTILDMGRTKEALLAMEYCDKSLVNVLENRGADYFEEKQILTIFRDVCNAVFAMHNLSPPIAHRDLKAENLLLGSDGLWKLCDFGSTSTNHKRFEKPEEMGIEEDNIRKHTTPAYRAPEMWDLYRREVINEKVDIWALGCLLFRICYLKSAFDGESKLQILNGNYRIPELPKYSSSITDLIRDMLQSSPDARPDITQIWFRVNGLLPEGLHNSLPDRPPELQQKGTNLHGAGVMKAANKGSPMPHRSPPPPPGSVAEHTRNVSPSHNPRAGASGSPLGAFWSSQHAKDSVTEEELTKSRYDDEPASQSFRNDINIPGKVHYARKSSYSKEENLYPASAEKNVPGKLINKPEGSTSKDFEINFFPDNLEHGTGGKSTFQNDSFNAFVADFDVNKLSPRSNGNKSEKEDLLEAEIEKLKEQLKQANAEKAEISSKYEKLSAICRSQRQEIQELKQALASKTQPTTPQSSEKIDGTIWELQQGFLDKSCPSPDPKTWQAFANDPKPQTAPGSNDAKSVRTRNGHTNKQGAEATSLASTWGFGTESFTASPAAISHVAVPAHDFSSSLRLGESKNIESKSASQPAGWAGF